MNRANSGDQSADNGKTADYPAAAAGKPADSDNSADWRTTGGEPPDASWWCRVPHLGGAALGIRIGVPRWCPRQPRPGASPTQHLSGEYAGAAGYSSPR